MIFHRLARFLREVVGSALPTSRTLVFGTKEDWAELNRLFYEKYPHLRTIACEECKTEYRDFENCPECGHSRRVQLALPDTVTFPSALAQKR